MKAFIKLIIMLFCVTAFSQEQKVDYQQINDELIKATYYFADNSSIVEKEGFFNKEGKLQDSWVSYDLQGNKTAIAYYSNGQKVGVWMYFKKDKINLVTYKDNKLIAVEEKALVLN
ncbi:MAG: membrane-binding protein [Lutibacter sp.]|jgi:antitoxin component YwqK of YwqJK toxin-antitoxin module